MTELRRLKEKPINLRLKKIMAHELDDVIEDANKKNAMTYPATSLMVHICQFIR